MITCERDLDFSYGLTLATLHPLLLSPFRQPGADRGPLSRESHEWTEKFMESLGSTLELGLCMRSHCPLLTIKVLGDLCSHVLFLRGSVCSSVKPRVW